MDISHVVVEVLLNLFRFSYLFCNCSMGNCKFSFHGLFSRALEVSGLSSFCDYTGYIVADPFLDF